MPKLRDIPDHAFGIDLRIDLSLAAHLRAPAAAWSLWPDAPFGASADIAVWPSAFTEDPAAQQDRILLAADEAPFWQAYGLWDDIGDMVGHMRPLPIETTAIALGLVHNPAKVLRDDHALGMLAKSRLTGDTLDMQAHLLGHDITDEFLSSALFDAARGPEFRFDPVARTAHGLIASATEAAALAVALERDDPGHAPLSVISVWSLGHRPATPA